MGEDEPGIAVARADRESFLGLLRTVRLECRHGDRGEPDETTRPRSFRFTQHGFASDVAKRLSNREPSRVEVDVGPCETECFGTPQSGREEQRPETNETILGSVGKERAHVFRGPSLHVRARFPRWIGRRGDVARDPSPLHGIAERAVYESVHLSDGDRAQR